MSIIGVASYIALVMGYQSLEYSYERFYIESSFHDYEIQATEGQWLDQSQLSTLTEGFLVQNTAIQAINYRLLIESGYNYSKKDIFITGAGKIVGYNTSTPYEQQINRLSIKDGKEYIPNGNSSISSNGSSNQVIVNNQFADRLNLKIEDQITLRMNKGKQVTIRGIAYSPEYAVVIPSKWGSIIPMNQYGIFYMPLSTVQMDLNLTGRINNILIKFIPETTDLVQKQIIKDYQNLIIQSLNVSLLDPVSSEFQVSNWFIRLNIEGFREIAQFLPFLVLCVATLTIFVSFNRLIYHQKREIGVILSLGFTPNDILIHYISYILIIAGIGAILGTITGIFFTHVVASFFGIISSIPHILVKIDPLVILFAGLMGFLASFIGGFYPAFIGSRLNPKQAIGNYTKALNLGKLAKLGIIDKSRLNVQIKMLFRNIFRNGWRSLTNTMGAAATMIVLFISLTLLFAMTTTINTEFNQINDYDLELTFTKPKLGDLNLYSELSKLKTIKTEYGIEAYDCVLEIPVIFFSDDLKKSNEGMLIGFNSSTPITHNFKWDTQFSTQWESPKSTIVLTSGLANFFGLENSVDNEIVVKHPRVLSVEEELWLRLFYFQNGRNTTLTLLQDQFEDSPYVMNYNQSTEFQTKNSRISVGGVSKELWGTMNYVSLDKMISMLGLSLFNELGIDLTPVSKIYIKLNSHGIKFQSQIESKLLSTLNDIESITTITQIQEGTEAYLEILNVLILLLIIVAIIISILSQITTVFLNTHERKKELLTMQVLGSSDFEISFGFLAENLLLTVLGLILGAPIGFRLTQMIVTTMFPMMVYLHITFEVEIVILIILSVIITSIVTQIPTLLSLFKLDLSLISKEFIG